MLAAGAPLSVFQIKELFDEPDKPAASEIRDALKVISSKYSEAGFELKEVASGFRFQIRDELSPWVSKLWQERPQKYSRALLETLSLIVFTIIPCLLNISISPKKRFCVGADVWSITLP